MRVAAVLFRLISAARRHQLQQQQQQRVWVYLGTGSGRRTHLAKCVVINAVHRCGDGRPGGSGVCRPSTHSSAGRRRCLLPICRLSVLPDHQRAFTAAGASRSHPAAAVFPLPSLLLTRVAFCVVLFCVICAFCRLVVLVRLSVPVQVIDWKDSSPKWPIIGWRGR